ncbi:MAG: rhodanese [Gloeobacteraceae cyanobacterium ES-bin-144]|nr:rhodanese [Verrucomicrobiales bacterium]
MSEDFTSLPDAATTLEISPRAVAAWIRKPHQTRPRLIDCREQDEVTLCRIEGYEWFPLGLFSEVLSQLTADSGRGIVVYCHHGMRSQRAVAFLRAHGVENAFSMSGGIDMWSEIIDPTVPRY